MRSIGAVREGVKPSPVTNATIAGLLRRYAGVIALQGANRFKVKAYRRAAETVEAAHERGGLLLRAKISPSCRRLVKRLAHSLARSSEAARYRDLSKPPENCTGLLELAEKPGLDPKKLLRIYKKLQHRQPGGASRKGSMRAKSRVARATMDFQLRQAWTIALGCCCGRQEKLVPGLEAYLASECGAGRIEPVGSLRRKKDTVSDLGFLVTGKTPR